MSDFGMQAVPPGRRRRGEQSAGRVLGIILVAFVIGALINADALVERAERKPLGDARDRALAIWHPVQDVAHVAQLHRLRDLADALVGNEDRGGSPTPGVPGDSDERAGGASTTTEPARRPELRSPTDAEPLRLWVGGDSMVRDLSDSVLRLTADEPRFRVTVHYEISSGLTRPDYYDWPAALDEDMRETEAEVVVIMFGANDGQGLIAADGTTYQRVAERGWQREYADRVAAVMDQLRADDRLVLWVVQPPMRDGDFDARMDILNRLYRQAAADRPWIELVETEPLFGDDDGAFAESLPSADGDIEDLRQDDGVHFSRAGADKLADHLLEIVEDELDAADGTPGAG